MFGPKEKYFFVDASKHKVCLARANYNGKRLEIEALEAVSTKDPHVVKKAIDHIGGFAHGQYVQAHCSVYPESRVFQRHKMPSAGVVETAAYFNKVATNEYQMDPKVYRVALAAANTGLPLVVGKEKLSHALFFGAKEEDILAQQEALLGQGIYPLSLQLGTLTAIAALTQYCEHEHCDQPLLFIEIGLKSTLLFVLHNGIQFSRRLALGIESLYTPLMQQLGFESPDLVENLVFSNAFDFSEVGAELLRDFIKEAQGCSTYYEAQTGQSIGYIFASLLPESLRWVPAVLGQSLDTKSLEINYSAWLGACDIRFSEKASSAKMDNAMLGLIGLMHTQKYD